MIIFFKHKLEYYDMVIVLIIFKINNLTRINGKPFQRALCPKVGYPGTELLLCAKYCSKKGKKDKYNNIRKL